MSRNTDSITSSPTGVPTLAERLHAARQRQFVGRLEECQGFEAALRAPELPYAVLHIYGPGGVGKTTLLSAFERSALAAGIGVVRLDARNIEASPEGFLFAVSLTLGLEPGQSPIPALGARESRQVLMIDTFELLSPLDGWMREHFLPQLGAETLVVLSGRRPPSQGWRADPGWADLVRAVPLRNLQPDESAEYLRRRGLPSDQHAAVLEFTHGHPLALSLVADTFSQRANPGATFDARLDLEPDVVKTLLERFLEQVPGPAHRAALEACALVRLTTEALLAVMLEVEDARELFEWLRGLSFVESGPLGVFPHDLAREAICHDLRWRNPDWNRELHRRARGYYTSRLQKTRGLEQQRLLMDDVYLHRENPMVKPFLKWGEFGSVYGETAKTSDHAALIEIVRTHQGETEARAAAHWFARQPQNLTIYRDAGRQPAGLLLKIDLHEATPDDLEADPIAARAWSFAQRQGQARDGEPVLLFRLWMAREGHQSVTPTQSLIFIQVVQAYLSTPRLSWSFFPCIDMDFWRPALTYMDLQQLPVEYEVSDFPGGARRFGVFGRDWRAMGIAGWLEMLGERELATEPMAASVPPMQAAPIAVLSKPEFEEAVRNALREYNRPTQLARNPLVRSRLVAERSDPARQADAQTLRRVMLEAAQTLSLNPRDEKLYRALEATYFEPAMTQELAAERLELPFSTFRRHLTAGVARLADTLWSWELQG
jgi:hypothetical protein